jgi:GT2 family glycosyltransferase
MSSGPTTAFQKALANALLLARIHFDAFRLSPVAYLKAARWWLVRKRVRARGQLAPLLSQSPKAYMLWGLRDEQENRSHSPRGQSPLIVALIDASSKSAVDEMSLDATLQSLDAEGVPALLVGADFASDLASADAVIDWGAQPWLMPMAAGDIFALGAAAAYRAAITCEALSLLYADDDQLDRWGRRTDPHFKPDWNSELFRHFDYLTGSCIVRGKQESFRLASNTADWAALLVQQAAQAGDVRHVQRVLHHRHHRTPAPVAVQPATLSGDMPSVTVIIPTRNRVDLLRTCLEGVMSTAYPRLDVIVVDNGSDDPETLDYLAALETSHIQVIRHPGPFNYSTINNRAAREAKGQLLCLLNNDIEVTSPDWLSIMATQAIRDDVGAVGAQLLYPDGRIQHAGVVIGVGNAAGHAHRFVQPQEEGYFRRHMLPQFTSAVTGACLVVDRERFLAVGGLDERNFAVAYNDVDLCLRLNQNGWQSLYEPRAVLIHHESVSRGLDLDPVGAARFAGELAALKRIWKTDEIVDPFHHPNLSRAAERFAVAI